MHVKPLITHSEVIDGVVVSCTRAHPLHSPAPPPDPRYHITAMMIDEESRLKKNPLWRKATRSPNRKPL